MRPDQGCECGAVTALRTLDELAVLYRALTAQVARSIAR